MLLVRPCHYFYCFVEILLNILIVCTNIYYKSDFFVFILHLHNLLSLNKPNN